MSTTPLTPVPGSIPPFTPSGVLPPFVGTDPTVLASVSPYKTTLSELVEQFATSTDRKRILAGYLAHRTELIALGFQGIQWLDGSFMENVEITEGRSPGDIDVVSFVQHPLSSQVPPDPGAWLAFVTANTRVLLASETKAHFNTDAYFVDIAMGPGFVIQQTAYWFALFSHKKVTSLWKGILEIPLDDQQDDVAATRLLATK
jgi:hypothetical protein